MQTLLWHKIAEHENEIVFQPNNMAQVDVDGKRIGLARHQDQLFAFSIKCPHAGGILTDGWIDSKGNVVCPVHCYRFNVQSGRNSSGEGYYLKHWPVEKRAGGIYIGMEKADYQGR